MKKLRWDRRALYRNGVLALILLCCALAAHEVFGNHGWLALRRQKTEYESLGQRIDRLKQENQELESQIKALKSDPKAIETRAREQLRLAKPGEMIITLPEKDPKAKPPVPHENSK